LQIAQHLADHFAAHPWACIFELDAGKRSGEVVDGGFDDLWLGAARNAPVASLVAMPVCAASLRTFMNNPG
jgi:hypothetical protein